MMKALAFNDSVLMILHCRKLVNKFFRLMLIADSIFKRFSSCSPILRKNFTLGTYRSLNAPLEKTINFLFLSPFVFTFKERIAQQPQEKSTNIFKMFWSLIFAKVEWFYLVNTNLSKGSNKDPKTSSINLLTKQKKSLFNGVSFLCSVCVILDYLDIVSSKIFTWVIISFFDLRKCLNSFA